VVLQVGISFTPYSNRVGSLCRLHFGICDTLVQSRPPKGKRSGARYNEERIQWEEQRLKWEREKAEADTITIVRRKNTVE
jgi:hypothetical protein